MLEIPRDIKLGRKPNQTSQVMLTGKDEFGNPKNDIIYCTPEEAEQIINLFNATEIDDNDGTIR